MARWSCHWTVVQKAWVQLPVRLVFGLRFFSVISICIQLPHQRTHAAAKWGPGLIWLGNGQNQLAVPTQPAVVCMALYVPTPRLVAQLVLLSSARNRSADWGGITSLGRWPHPFVHLCMCVCVSVSSCAYI